MVGYDHLCQKAQHLKKKKKSEHKLKGFVLALISTLTFNIYHVSNATKNRQSNKCSGYKEQTNKCYYICLHFKSEKVTLHINRKCALFKTENMQKKQLSFKE